MSTLNSLGISVPSGSPVMDRKSSINERPLNGMGGKEIQKVEESDIPFDVVEPALRRGGRGGSIRIIRQESALSSVEGEKSPSADRDSGRYSGRGSIGKDDCYPKPWSRPESTIEGAGSVSPRPPSGRSSSVLSSGRQSGFRCTIEENVPTEGKKNS